MIWWRLKQSTMKSVIMISPLLTRIIWPNLKTGTYTPIALLSEQISSNSYWSWFAHFMLLDSAPLQKWPVVVVKCQGRLLKYALLKIMFIIFSFQWCPEQTIGLQHCLQQVRRRSDGSIYCWEKAETIDMVAGEIRAICRRGWAQARVSKVRSLGFQLGLAFMSVQTQSVWNHGTSLNPDLSGPSNKLRVTRWSGLSESGLKGRFHIFYYFMIGKSLSYRALKCKKLKIGAVVFEI